MNMATTPTAYSNADTIVGCSCPGCGQLVQYVAGQYTPSGEDEFWRFGLAGEDMERDCSTCQKRPEDRS